MAGVVTKPDAQIERDVVSELKRAAHIQPNEIGLAVKDGVVTLPGKVDSFPKTWAAGAPGARHS
jgi:osmotically-inducible protein OsmY